MDLDGALVIRAAPGAKVVVKSLRVKNAGWQIEEASDAECQADEMMRMRGYKVDKKEAKEVIVKTGTHVISE